MKNFIFFASITAMLSACVANKPKNTSSSEIVTSSSKKQFYYNILKESNFDVLKIASKIDIPNTPHVNATIYIENNEKIWMNLSALFINVARGIATPQGLKAYEKIDKTYIDSDFTYLNKLLNINFLDYKSLQNLLIGKSFIPINEEDYTFSQGVENYILTSKKNQKIEVNNKINEYRTELEFSRNFDLVKVLLTEVSSHDELQLFYDNWVSINQHKFPKNVKIIIKGKKNKQILIENTKFEFSRMETPYNVPNNYKKRDL